MKNFTGYFVDKEYAEKNISKSSKWHLLGKVKIENGNLVELTFQNVTSQP